MRPRGSRSPTSTSREEFEGLGQFDFGASGQLLLFVFLTSLTGAATLIQARRNGVVARMIDGTDDRRPVIAGQTLGRWAIGAVPGRLHHGGHQRCSSASLGQPPAARWSCWPSSAWSLPAPRCCSARWSTTRGRPSASASALGLVLAALGGAMFPLEFFPDTMRALANVTPHAWAYEAFAEVQRHDGGSRRAAAARGARRDGRVLVGARGVVAAPEPGARDVGPR